MSKKYSGVKKGMLIGGIILLIFGIILLIYGFLGFAGVHGSSGEGFDGINERASQGFSSIFSIAGGGFLTMIGLALIYISQIRRVTKYVATETAPAVTTVTEAAGEGIAKGINKSGGIKVSSQSTEKIMIKCRECGYLESIDAEFCSKCGKKI